MTRLANFIYIQIFTKQHGKRHINIIESLNYLIKFKRIRANDYKRLLKGSIRPDKWLDSLIFIWSSKFYKWSLTIVQILLNSNK
jgi:hypothetical protein